MMEHVIDAIIVMAGVCVGIIMLELIACGVKDLTTLIRKWRRKSNEKR